MSPTTKSDTWTAVDRYVAALLVEEDEALSGARRASDEAGLPAISVSPVQGKLLFVLAQLLRAQSILEIGTLGGYSTIWLARALPSGGKIVTLEADPKHADVARANIARAGLARAVDLRPGRALETLPQLEAEGAGPFDLFFIDADKPNYPQYLEWALRLSRVGSLIVADNVVRGGALSDAHTTDPNVRAMRRMTEMLASDPRVSATVLQTVGSKGYDGFALALVTAR